MLSEKSSCTTGHCRDEATLFTMKGNERVKLQTSAIFAPGKTVVLFALPGAFTPGRSKKHLPSFDENLGDLERRGVDTVACLASLASVLVWGYLDIGPRRPSQLQINIKI